MMRSTTVSPADRTVRVDGGVGPMSQWARDYWEALNPASAGGGYINFMMSEGQDPIVASYRHNYDRLARIKARYDPDNFFHVNQNIQPASQAGASA